MYLATKIEDIMKKYYYNKDGYRQTIKNGINSLSEFSKLVSGNDYSQQDKIKLLKKRIENADAIVIGGGSGLSTSAGLVYDGERFDRYFFDFKEKYGINNIYAGGFYNFPKSEIKWAWWARHIYFNRYVKSPKPVYENLFSIVEDKDYFVITTNVDHRFQMAGFDKNRIFYTQGDYGLFQSVNPSLKKTYDNEKWVMEAMKAQGFVKDSNGEFNVADDKNILMEIPSDMIPRCPDDNSNVRLNLREDEDFVEDDGWNEASYRYYDFLTKHKDDKVVYLELGVGKNTPVIIKYPFWQMTLENKNASYICINYNEALCPREIENRSICINEDIGDILDKVLKLNSKN